MASDRTCPHPDADRLHVSGTQLRKWLQEGNDVPVEFSRTEVLDILREYYAGIDTAGKVGIGLSGPSAR
jgi:sulfate adenylyltransferase